jgi:hypothetical protein
MSLNSIESLVLSKFEQLEKELEQPVIDWVTQKLQEFKTQGKYNTVEILSGNGMWIFVLNGKSLSKLGVHLEYLSEQEKVKYQIIKEIDDTLSLLAEKRNLYLSRNIEV